VVGRDEGTGAPKKDDRLEGAAAKEVPPGAVAMPASNDVADPPNIGAGAEGKAGAVLEPPKPARTRRKGRVRNKGRQVGLTRPSHRLKSSPNRLKLSAAAELPMSPTELERDGATEAYAEGSAGGKASVVVGV
jgi:hypothetical protein